MGEAKRTPRSGDRAVRRVPSAQRVRAARAWIGLERPAFAEKTGISRARLTYLENGKGPPRPEELDAIQRATGVPMSFLTDGFDIFDDEDMFEPAGAMARPSLESELIERLEQISERVAALEAAPPVTSLPLDLLARALEELARDDGRAAGESSPDESGQGHLRRAQEGDVG